MKKFKSDDLLDSLKYDVQQIIQGVEMFKQMDKVKLAYTQTDNQWTPIQCLEHLNMYNRYYLPAIQKAMTEKVMHRKAWFTSGLLGNYFTNMMKPTNVFEIKNKMKTAKETNPASGLNVDGVVNEFLEHQQTLLHLLEAAKQTDLGAIRIPISISKMMKLKLGDTFRFLIAHEQRHLLQARNAVHKLGIATDKFPVLLQTKKMQPSM